MKHTGRLILIGVLIGLAAYWVFIADFQPGMRSFSITDTAAVHAVTISSPQDTAALKRKDGQWFVSGNYSANPEKVNLLLTVLHRMRVKSVIEQEGKPPLKGKHRVWVQMRNASPKIWYIGDTVASLQATEFIHPEEPQRVYLLHLPVYDFSIKTALVSAPFYWRNKQLMAARPGKIRKISLRYSDSEKQGFTLIQRQDSAFIKAGRANQSKSRIARYLSYFADHVTYEAEASPKQVNPDTLLKQTPAIELLLQTKNDTTTLGIYRMPAANSGHPYNLNKAYAALNKRPPVFIIRYYALDPWLKERSYFFKR